MRGVGDAGWPRWLNGGAVLLIGAAVSTLYGALLVASTLWRASGPMPADMLAFLAAARLAAAGQAARAYDWSAFAEVQAAVLGTGTEAISGALGWLNPPHFFFAVLPLAPFGYAGAWLLWTLAGITALAFAAWKVLPRPAAVVAVLAAPSTMLCISVGQNGLLIAALFGLTFALLDRRPVAAGIALGLLTVKPQFGVLLPLLLLLTGRWRAFAVAAVVTLIAALLAWVVFGSEAWQAFLPSLSANAQRMLGGEVSPRIQSVYGFLMRLTGQRPVAMAGHGLLALAATGLALHLWLRRPEAPAEARAAAAIAASYLITPYVWGYDTPAIPIAALFLVRAALRDGWLPGEKAILVGVCLLPATLVVLQYALVAPAAWWLLLWSAWRRARETRQGASGQGQPELKGTKPFPSAGVG